MVYVFVSLCRHETFLHEGTFDIEEAFLYIIEDLINLPGSVRRLIFAIVWVPLNFLDHLIKFFEGTVGLRHWLWSGTRSRIDLVFSLLAVDVVNIIENGVTDAALVRITLRRTVWRCMVNSLASGTTAPVASKVEANIG